MKSGQCVLRTQELRSFTFPYLTGSSQHAAMGKKSSVVTEKKLKDTHEFYSHSLSELHLWCKDPVPPNALKTPPHETLGAGRGWRPGASLSSCPGICRMHWPHVQKPLPIMQFGFCTPWISQGRLSNQFMFSELFKCMLCLHDRWLWPPLNHPFFPGIFFSPSKIKIKRSLKEYCKRNRKFTFFSQLILMKSSNPDGMNNSTYLRADRDVGHRKVGQHSRTHTWGLGASEAWVQIPDGQLLVLLSWASCPHLSVLRS